MESEREIIDQVSLFNGRILRDSEGRYKGYVIPNPEGGYIVVREKPIKRRDCAEV